MHKAKKVISTVLVSFVLFFALSTIFVYGMNVGAFQKIGFQNSTDILGGTSDDYNSSGYPFDKGGAEAIPFNILYGTRHSLVEYKGEIPFYLKDGIKKDDGSIDEESKENVSKFTRYYNGTKIDNKNRLYSSGTFDEKNKNAKKAIENTKESVKNIPGDAQSAVEKDLHTYPLTQSHDSDRISFIGVMVGALDGLNFLASRICGIVISLQNMSLSDLISEVDKNDKFSKALTSLFGFYRDGNEALRVSPFLMIGIISMVFGLVSLAFNYLKRGRSTKKSLVSEVVMLVVAFGIAMAYTTPGTASKVSNVATSALTSFSNQAVMMSSDTTSIFTGKSSGYSDAINSSQTQKALLDKAVIDSRIHDQFGYPVDELNIYANSTQTGKKGVDANGVGGFGDPALALEAFNSINNVDYSTYACGVTNGESVVYNLGYYFWACNSGTAVRQTNLGETNYPLFSEANGKTQVETGTNDRVLYTFDFLNYIYQNTEDAALKHKIETIFTNFSSPSYGSALLHSLMFIVLFGCLTWALFIVFMFTFVGKVVITFGSYAMVVMPFLLLIRKLRDTAKRFITSYLYAFLRFIIGMSIFNMIIIITVMLSSQGFMGIAVACVASILSAKFGPNLLHELNAQISARERRNGLNQIVRVNSSMDKKFMGASKKVRNPKEALGEFKDRAAAISDAVSDKFGTQVPETTEPVKVENAEGRNTEGEKADKTPTNEKEVVGDDELNVKEDKGEEKPNADRKKTIPEEGTAEEVATSEMTKTPDSSNPSDSSEVIESADTSGKDTKTSKETSRKDDVESAVKHEEKKEDKKESVDKKLEEVSKEQSKTPNTPEVKTTTQAKSSERVNNSEQTNSSKQAKSEPKVIKGDDIFKESGVAESMKSPAVSEKKVKKDKKKIAKIKIRELEERAKK